MNDPALAEPSTTAPAAKKQPNRQRRHVDHFRTSDEEHAELAARAAAAGLSVDAFCRLKTLGEPGPRSRRRLPTGDSRERAKALAALNHIGGNLNQGFRALNEIALAAPATTYRDRLAFEIEMLRKELAKELDALTPALEAVRDAFGSGAADDSEG